MVEPTPASPTPPAAPSPAPAPAPGVASPTPPSNAAPAAAPAPSGEVSRPDWLPETLWDADKKAPKADDIKGIFEARKADEERRAALPQTPQDYKTEFAKDFALPEGWQVNENDPMWALGKELAHKHGWSQDQLNDLATGYVKNQIDAQKAIGDAVKARDASLGPNGGARVEALNTFFKGLFGDQVGQQFAQTLFTKDIVEGFEKVQSALVKQGVTSFSGTGRNGSAERTDGRPQNWESMSPIDRRTWDLANPQPQRQ